MEKAKDNKNHKRTKDIRFQLLFFFFLRKKEGSTISSSLQVKKPGTLSLMPSLIHPLCPISQVLLILHDHF